MKFTFDQSDPPPTEDLGPLADRLNYLLSVHEARVEVWSLIESTPVDTQDSLRAVALMTGLVMGIPCASYQRRGASDQLSAKRTRQRVRKVAHAQRIALENVQGLQRALEVVILKARETGDDMYAVECISRLEQHLRATSQGADEEAAVWLLEARKSLALAVKQGAVAA